MIVEQHEIDVRAEALERLVRRIGFDDVDGRQLSDRSASDQRISGSSSTTRTVGMNGDYTGSAEKDPVRGSRVANYAAMAPRPSRPCRRCRTVFRPRERPRRESASSSTSAVPCAVIRITRESGVRRRSRRSKLRSVESGSFKSSRTTPISCRWSTQARASRAEAASRTVKPSASRLSVRDQRIRLSSSTTRMASMLGEYLQLLGEIPAPTGARGGLAIAKTLAFSMPHPVSSIAISSLDPHGIAADALR